MTTRSMRVNDDDYQLAAQRALDEDRPIARVVSAAIRAYCDAEPVPPNFAALADDLARRRAQRRGHRDEVASALVAAHPASDEKASLAAKLEQVIARKGVKVAAEEPLHAGRVPPTNGPPPVPVGDHSPTNGPSAACTHGNERLLAWGVVCSDCGKKLR